MEEQTKYTLTKRRTCALLTVIVMILNMFSPYSILLNQVQAAEPVAGEPYYELSILKPSTDQSVIDNVFSPEDDAATYWYYWDYMTGNVASIAECQKRAVVVQLRIKGCSTVGGGSINLQYDSSKLQPTWEKVTTSGRRPNIITTYSLEEANEYSEFAETGWGSKDFQVLDKENSQILLIGSMSAEQITAGKKYIDDGEVVGTFIFKLADGVTIDDLTTDTFTSVPHGQVLTGLRIGYNDGLDWVDGNNYLKFDGFSQGQPKVDSIELKTPPTKDTYYDTEDLDFTGGKITVNYDIGEPKEIDIKEELAAGTLTVDSTTADDGTRKVTFTYDGQTAEFEYYTLESISKKTDLTKMNYEHNDTVVFAGGKLDATYKKSDGTTKVVELDIPTELGSGALEVNNSNTAKADVDNKTLTYNYHGKTATMELNVTDPLESISITKQPASLTFNDGVKINLTGVEVTPKTRSGKALTPIALPDSRVTISTDTADINSIPEADRWEIKDASGNPTGLKAGHQTIVLTYAGKSADLVITVDDVVNSVTITKQPTAKNKFGISANQLDFTGLEATVTTNGGGSFKVGPNSLAINTSNYVSNTLNTQSFTAKYGNITVTNNVEIELTNYITGITVNFPDTEFDYGTTLAGAIANATYKEVYADGTESSSTKAITTGMVTGYNGTPAASLFDSSGKYAENLTIKLTSSSNPFDVLPAVANQSINIKDVVDEAAAITVKYKPTMTYNYGDTFKTNGGMITLHYKSGRTQDISIGNSSVSVTEADGTDINMSPAADTFTNEQMTKPLKVTYTEGSKSYSTELSPLTIYDILTGIKVNSPETNFIHGNTFNIGSGTITASYQSGKTDTLNFSNVTFTETVSGGAPDISPLATAYTNNSLTKNITASYTLRGVTKTDAYNITIKNPMKSIRIGTPPKASYGLNESIANAGGTIIVTREAGNEDEPKNIQDAWISGLNTASAGNRTATVTYTEDGVTKTTTYPYSVSDKVNAITITPPTKVKYKHGESLDLTGAKIEVTYTSNKKEERTMTSAMITEDGAAVNMSPSSYDSTQKVSKVLVITYTEDGVTKSINYPIEIINDVQSIKMQDYPKQKYNVNETEDLSGGSILVTRKVGTPEVIDLADTEGRVKVTGFNSSTENASLPITVTFTENGFSCTPTGYNIEVKDSVTSIIIKTPPTKDQKYNEELNLTGAELTVVSGSGTKDVPMSDATITGYDKTTLGEQTLTVTYGGQTETFKVTVKDYVTGIKLSRSTIEREIGDELADLISDNSITYTVTYAKAGDKSPETLLDTMVAGYDNTTTEGQSLTVTYEDKDTNSFTNGQTFNTTLNINFKNTAKSIKITPPTKVKYKHGESLDLTGGQIEITNQDNTTSYVTMEDTMITESGAAVNMSPSSYDSTQKVSKTLVITYTKDGVTENINYPIEIINDVQSIEMHDYPKQKYNVNETEDLSGGSILVTRKVGTPEVIDLADTEGRVTVTGFNSSTENASLPITVTFTENGFSCEPTGYNIEVKDSVTSIIIKTPPTKDQKYNEELNLTGAELTVVSGSGTKKIPMSDATITGYDKTTLGEQTLTVTYGGQTETFKVTVKDYVTGIKLSTSTIERGVGDELSDLITDNSITYTVTYAKAGDKSPEILLDTMVPGYDKTSKLDQILTVTYTDTDTNSFTNGQTFNATLNANFKNTAKSIKITPPTKVKYKHGESLDLTGGQIEITNQDNTTSNVTMEDTMITESGAAVNMSPSSYDSTQKVSKTLVITYTKDGVTETANYPIEIINDVQSIAMQDYPKQKYNVNETEDLSGGSILVTRKAGTPEVIDLIDTEGRVTVTGFNSSTENASLPITVTFTENGFSCEPTGYNIEVKDSVTSISIKTPPTKDQKYNEELNLTGAELTVVSGSGPKDIPMSDATITGYDKTTLGEQTLTVTYGGQTETFKVTVKDYVTGIKVNPDTITGEYNKEFADLITDNSITYTVTYAKAGDQSPETLLDTMVPGYDKTSKQNQNLTVKYKDTDTESFTNGQTFETPFTVEANNPVTGIVITPPTKVKYKHGESLDLTGGTITLTHIDNTTSNVTMKDTMITESGAAVNMSPSSYDSTQKVSKTLVITYTKDGVTESINYPIEIINDVQSIKMQDYPKQKYNVKDTEDLSGGSILVTRKVGTPEVIDLADTEGRVTVTGFNSSTENASLPITVTFTENGFSCEPTGYNIEVKDNVTSISIKTPPTKDQKYNEELNLTGAELTVVSGSGTKEIPMSDATITGYDKTTLGEQTLTVTYGGQTETFKVTVKDYVTGIKVNPDTVTGKYNEELSKVITDNSITYTVTYAKAGDQSPETLLDTMVPGYDKTSKQTQNLKVKYKDTDTDSFTNGQTFEADLEVTLENTVTGVKITKPTKTEYNHGEELVLTTGKITLTYEDGNTKDIPITKDMITESGAAVNMSPSSYDSTQKVSKTLTITYTKDGKTDTVNYPIEIINNVKEIKIKTKPKDKYNIGDTEDLSGGKITVIRAVGTEDISFTDTKIKVTGFDSSSENTKLPITVTFTENGIKKTTGYDISVIDKVIDVEIKNKPKQAYKYGESLDISKGTLKVTRASGVTEIPMKESMVTELDGTPFNSENLTPRKLKVTYGGKEMFYDITVSDYVVGIKVTPPKKTEYECGESLSLAEGKVQKVMASGSPTTPVALDNSEVTLSTFDPNKEGTQSIKVTYAGFTESFVVKVEDNVQSIKMQKTPKTAYKYGESLNVAGGTIIATKSSGKTEVISITASMVSGYSPNVLGDKDLTVTYKGKTTSYKINVADYVKDIEIEKPKKLVYKIGEKINLDEGYIKKIMASGKPSEKVKMSNEKVTIQGFDTSKEGSKEIKVTYEGFTKSFGITIIDPVSDIRIKTLPNKLDYLYGESLNLDGGTIEIVKESGASTIVKITKDMVSKFNPKKLGNQKLTVTYKGTKVSGEIIVNVKDYISHLKVTAPEKTEYEYGEYLDLSKGKVAIIMASGKTQEEADMTASMLTGYNLKQEGKQKVQVEYKDLKGNFNITVVDKVKAISMEKEPDKTNYEYGEKLDVTGAKIKVFKSSGEAIIDVTEEMVSGYTPQKTGTQMITVTYKGFTTKFIVIVNEKAEEPVKPEEPNKQEEPNKPEDPEPQVNKEPETPKKAQTTVTKVVKETVIIKEEPKPEEPIEEPIQEPAQTPQPVQETPKVEEPKPTETLGVKDEKKDKDIDKDKLIAAGFGLGGLLLLLLLLLTRRNVKIYVEEDGKFELGGLDKVSKNNLSINVDKYLDGDTYQNRVKVVLTDAISEKLDGKVLEIKHRGEIKKYTIKYKDEPYEIVLE